MKVLIVLALATLAYANVEPSLQGNTAYGYIQNYAIPLAEEIRKAEKQMSQERIVGGNPSSAGDFPYQAGLLASYADISGTGVCGGSLVSADRVITAAHCWFDGIDQAKQFIVVLGSITIFTGGTRVVTQEVVVHPNWLPALIRNDVAVIYLPTSVTLSGTIFPIALPSGSQLNESFAGTTAVASGFGLTSDGGSISTNQFLSHASLRIIFNSICSIVFPGILQPSNICTSGIRGSSTCSGDSGGPLAVTIDGRPILVGISSFVKSFGCEVGLPAAYARVTSYVDFFSQHI